MRAERMGDSNGRPARVEALRHSVFTDSAIEPRPWTLRPPAHSRAGCPARHPGPRRGRPRRRRDAGSQIQDHHLTKTYTVTSPTLSYGDGSSAQGQPRRRQTHLGAGLGFTIRVPPSFPPDRRIPGTAYLRRDGYHGRSDDQPRDHPRPAAYVQDFATPTNPGTRRDRAPQHARDRPPPATRLPRRPRHERFFCRPDAPSDPSHRIPHDQTEQHQPTPTGSPHTAKWS